MLYLSYNLDPARDPYANSSQLGSGAVPLQFSETSRPAFDAPQAPGVVALGARVNRNVCFTPDPASDHYGNAADGSNSVAGDGPRFTYWLPDPTQPLSAGGELPDDLPGWVQEVAAGRRLQRPARAWELPAWARQDTPPSVGDAAVGARL